MTSLRLSIAMATYNGMPYLTEQLESLARQSRLPDELIICDEASSDGTVKAIEIFAASAPFPVRFHANPKRLGLIRNFEKAATLSTGDIIFFCDQDDVWLPEKLAEMEQQFVANPNAQVILNDAALTRADLSEGGRTQYGNILHMRMPPSRFVTGCCSAHRRSFHDLVFPTPEGAPIHDLWLNGMAHFIGCSSIHPRVLQLYRRHGANESEWSLSDPAGVTRSAALREHGLEDARVGWQGWANLLTLFIDRVSHRRDIAARFVPSGDVEAALDRIRLQRARLERRITLGGVPRWRRALPVLRFQLGGGYRDASGWLSAVKDMVRP